MLSLCDAPGRCDVTAKPVLNGGMSDRESTAAVGVDGRIPEGHVVGSGMSRKLDDAEFEVICRVPELGLLAPVEDQVACGDPPSIEACRLPIRQRHGDKEGCTCGVDASDELMTQAAGQNRKRVHLDAV